MGAGFGITQSFTDVQSYDFSRAAYGNLEYFLTPFVSGGLEFQMGKIKGGDAATDRYGRGFVNSYKAATINGKLFLGALVDYERSAFLNAIKGGYFGLGAGLVRNWQSTIARKQKNTGYVFPGKNASTDLLLPVNLGINFYFPDRQGIPRFAINLNYQGNVTLGEGLDGYDDSPVKFDNGNPDIYNFYTIGLRYHFGLIGISKKPL